MASSSSASPCKQLLFMSRYFCSTRFNRSPSARSIFVHSWIARSTVEVASEVSCGGRTARASAACPLPPPTASVVTQPPESPTDNSRIKVTRLARTDVSPSLACGMKASHASLAHHLLVEEHAASAKMKPAGRPPPGSRPPGRGAVRRTQDLRRQVPRQQNR
eukprot:766148-Hanusia_phi.AAC.1